MKKIPKEWVSYQNKKGIAYLTYFWKFDARKKENKIPLKTKITLKEFEDIYCKG